MVEKKIKIFVACDHAGFDLKDALVKNLSDKFDFVDFGTNSGVRSVDYPFFVHKAVKAYIKYERDLDELSAACKMFGAFGLLICGSGVGVSITANRNRFIRAALCADVNSATLARQHNNANFLCLGARVTNLADANDIVLKFTSEPFIGGRHLRRVKKINLRVYRRSIFGVMMEFFDRYAEKIKKIFDK